MRTLKNTLWAGCLAGLALTGCDLFSSGAVTPPPPAAEVLESNPVPTTEPSPNAVPSTGGAASQGDIIFVRDGQLRAIGTDGSSDRSLSAFPGGSVLRDLAISPDGRYLAFSLNAVSVILLEFSSGTLVPLDQVAAGSIGRFVWSPTGDVLYYHKLVLDANSIPSTSEVRSASMPPGNFQSVLESSLATGPAAAPAFVLVDGTIILHQFDPAQSAMGMWLGYSLSSGLGTALFIDHGIWDVSPDSSRVLLFSQADVSPGQQRIPAPLSSAPLMAGASVTQISPMDEESAYWSARFAPDGSHIMALRYVRVNDATHGEAVLFRPAADGSYEVIQLSPDPAAEDVAFAWYGEEGVVVQRMRTDAAEALAAELWLLPLDGSPGRMLTLGEMPVVVGGR